MPLIVANIYNQSSLLGIRRATQLPAWMCSQSQPDLAKGPRVSRLFHYITEKLISHHFYIVLGHTKVLYIILFMRI